MYNFTVVQGPPGTGKTSTVSELIKVLLEETEDKILVCSASNIAIDNICEKISSLDMVRFVAERKQWIYDYEEKFPIVHRIALDIA